MLPFFFNVVFSLKIKHSRKSLGICMRYSCFYHHVYRYDHFQSNRFRPQIVLLLISFFFKQDFLFVCSRPTWYITCFCFVMGTFLRPSNPGRIDRGNSLVIFLKSSFFFLKTQNMKSDGERERIKWTMFKGGLMQVQQISTHVYLRSPHKLI